MKRTFIIVPCYNESQRLPAQAFLREAEANPDLSFVFVDDGSTDNTKHVLQTLCTQLPKQLYCVPLPKNQGKAEAVRQGMLYAFQFDASFIGYWDADLSTPLNEIHRLLQAFDNDEIEMAMGARTQLLGRQIKRNPYRHYLGRVFATGASLVLRLPVYDTQCGAKLLRNTEPVRMLFEKPFATKWIFDVEILARMILQYAPNGQTHVLKTIVEVPLLTWVDVPGTNVKLKDFFVATKDLLHIAKFMHMGAIRERLQ